MRTIDRIRNYILEQNAKGFFKPGDKLPSYHELMAIGQGSYATVRSAMNKLEAEGLLDIRNGSGTFLAGGNLLRLQLYINCRALPPDEMQSLLDKHLPALNLNIDVQIHDARELSDPQVCRQILNEEQAVLTIAETDMHRLLPQSRMDLFEGFADFCTALQSIPGKSKSVALPFASYTYQLGFSRTLLRQIGFDPARISGDIGSWWDEYAALCRKHTIHPTAMLWPEGSTDAIMRFYGLLFALAGYDHTLYSGADALFQSDAGRRFLRIMDDTFFYGERSHEGSFFAGGAGVSFNIGSWITRQNETERRPDIHVREFEAVPFEHCGRRFYPASVDYLECYMRDDLPLEKRKRTWQFIQLLLSRDFQRDYCNCCGMISLRNDIRPQEYTWNTNSGGNSFCPVEGDLIVYEDQVFPESVRGALSILLEDYKFHAAAPETILQRMDAKKCTSLPVLNINKENGL